MNGEFPAGWKKDIPAYEEGKSLATRASSGEVLNAIAKNVPSFFGGSADLAGSNKTYIKGQLTSYQDHMKDAIFGLVYVNLRWVLL